jgi:dipeptidase
MGCVCREKEIVRHRYSSLKIYSSTIAMIKKLFAITLAATSLQSTEACTNVIISTEASADGATLLGDNDDTAKRFGAVTHFAAATWPEGSTRDIYDFEGGFFRGVIAQPSKTVCIKCPVAVTIIIYFCCCCQIQLNVMGGANELGVVIAESTMGGISELQDGSESKILDYGSLITATLQRATSARDAISVMVNLTDTYGYSSTMEGFSITDGTEAWHMEAIGRGAWGKGILYVAMKVPEGYIAGHANQARITQFLEACKDPSVCLASDDIVQFAIDRGYYEGAVDDPSFSFSDIYDPVTVNGARFCEARVWYMFANLADPADFDPAMYLDYAQGLNLTNRMPLFVRAKKEKVTRDDVHAMMSSRFEGSWFDPSVDVGAGAEHSPYRWNGLTWSSADGTQYLNERIVGTQSTAWHFVAVVNAKLPPPMRALLYFGVDDHAWSPKVPLYGGAVAVHRSYDDGNCSARLACRQGLGLPGYMMSFDWDAAFWVNTAVAKMVYAEKDRAASIVAQARCDFEKYLSPLVASVTEEAVALFNSGDDEKASSLLTSLAMETTEEATKRWTMLWQQLMVTNADGYTATGK